MLGPKSTAKALPGTPAPPQVQFWLDLIRDIPPDQELARWPRVDLSGCATLDATAAKLLRAYEPLIVVLPEAAQNYVRTPEVKDLRKRYAAVDERYEWLRGALGMFRAIARARSGACDLHVDLPYEWGLIRTRIDRENRIRFVVSSLLADLDGVNADRIRECENQDCRRLFWARRKDKHACSLACANVRRVRKWRAQYQEQYKESRIEHDAITGRPAKHDSSDIEERTHE
jgi:hypothetical protein